jgi:hypothetical protein
MLEKYQQILDTVRKNPKEWQQFSFQPKRNLEGHVRDVNALKRYQLLIAIQHDLRKGDESLLVFLFRQEVDMHTEPTIQGLSPSLSLNAYLLSIFGDPKNLPLFIAAKTANFDTHCGFDREFLVCLNLQITYKQVKKLSKAWQDKFFEYFDTNKAKTNLSPKQWEVWRDAKDKQYIVGHGNKTIEQEIYLAEQLQENAIKSQKITEWIAQQTQWTEENLTILAHYEKSRKNIKGQIEAFEKIIDFKKTDWDKAVHFQMLAELYLSIKSPDVAWQRLKDGTVFLENIPDWGQVNLGRFFVEGSLAILLQKMNVKDAISQEVYAWMLDKVDKIDGHYPNLLEKIVKVAQLWNNQALQVRYERVLEDKKEELRQINEKIDSKNI